MAIRKALLVAMSGVRVRDAALRELGMTLPGFVDRGQVIAELPSLGLLTVAAWTPEHWQVAYHEIDDLPDDVAAWASAQDADMVAISALTARIRDAYALSDALRRHGITVVLGGLHVSALPDEAARHADAVVVGQGERLWPRLLADIEAGRLERRYRAGREERLLDEARVPRYDLIDPRCYNRIPVQTTRGCPFDCIFCGASRLISRRQTKPLAQVERELELICERWPRPFIELADDNTFVDKAWGRELAALLGEYPVHWFTESDISLADDEELLRIMARSGCAQVLIGLEASTAEALAETDTRGWKRQRLATYRSAIRRIQDHGIMVNGCFVLGFDHHDRDVFARTRDFVEELGLAEVQITLLTPFPGTELRRRLEEQGRILPSSTWDDYTLFDPTFRPARMDVEQLHEGFAWLMEECYADAPRARRRRIGQACLRRRPRRPTAASSSISASS